MHVRADGREEAWLAGNGFCPKSASGPCVEFAMERQGLVARSLLVRFLWCIPSAYDDAMTWDVTARRLGFWV